MAQRAGGCLLALELRPLIEDHGIPLAIMGMFVVFVALILVSLFIIVLPRSMAVLARWSSETKEPSTQRGSQARAEDGVPEEMLVIISAAVAEVISEPHRIIHTRDMTAEELGWSLEGRLQHHSSHNIRQRERH
jgi:Na+-transporting methylmalonyl-CoA/oxaloacetate decarboxylase gamma subunit